jgi:hypothetical protein
MGWLSGWSYRKSHEILAAAGAGTLYQKQVTVHYGSGVDSDDDVYLAGKCRSDFGDVRFTDDDGSALLDYWMESKINGDYAVFWVEVADDLSSVNLTIYIYYSKPLAVSTSNGVNTFLLFDHFPGPTIDLNIWNKSGNPTIFDSFVQLKLTALEEIYSKTLFGLGTAIRGYGKLVSSGITGECTIGYNNDIQDANVVEIYSYKLDDSRKLSGFTKKAGAAAAVAMDENQGNILRTWDVMRPHSALVEYRVADGVIKQITDPTKIPTDDYACNLFARYAADLVEFDWVFVRKYVNPEPQHGAWGSEEYGGENVAPADALLVCVISEIDGKEGSLVDAGKLGDLVEIDAKEGKMEEVPA